MKPWTSKLAGMFLCSFLLAVGCKKSANLQLIPGKVSLPAGTPTKTIPQGAATVVVPAGGDWKEEQKSLSWDFYNNKLDVTVQLSTQKGIPLDSVEDSQKQRAMEEYAKEHAINVKRTIPIHKVTGQKTGWIGTYRAVQIYGKFVHDSVEYMTKDYLIFGKNQVVTIMTQGPTKIPSAIDQVKTLSDAIALSYK